MNLKKKYLRNLLLKIPRKYLSYKKFLKDKKQFSGYLKPVEVLQKQETVVLVSHSAETGGAPVLLINIGKELYRRGYQIIIISKNYGELLHEFSSIGKTIVCRNIRELEKNQELFDSVNILGCICNSITSAEFIPFFKKRYIKTEMLIHEMVNTIIHIDASKYAKLACIKSDVLIFPSSFVKKKFEEVFDIKCRTEIKAQGLYFKSPNIQTYDKKQCKSLVSEEYKIPFDDRMVVLNVATSNFRKGFDIFWNMAQMDPLSIYIWVGYTADNLKMQLQGKKADNLYLIDYVNDPDKLFCLYKCADVFALTSREEPFGSVVLESFSVGVPVVAFDMCGGYVDIVQNNITGSLVQGISERNMLEAILTLKSENRWNEYKNNCMELASNMRFERYVEFLLENLI